MLTRHSGGLLEDNSGVDSMLRLLKSKRERRAERTNRAGKKISPEDEKKRRSTMIIAASPATPKARVGKKGTNRKIVLQLPQLLMRAKDHPSAKVPLLERARNGVGFITTI